MSFGNKIGELPLTSTPVSRATETRIQSDGAERPATTSASSTDETKVSAAGSMIIDALQTSDVRMEKIEALRQAISNGSYSVPSHEVADSIIQSMMESPGPGSVFALGE